MQKFKIIIIILVILSNTKYLNSKPLVSLHMSEKYFFQSEKPQVSSIDNNSELLLQAYGYLKGQQFTLERIKKEYPTLSTKIYLCETAFRLGFGKAEENIITQLKTILGNNFVTYKNNFEIQMDAILQQQVINEESAIDFINEVCLRATGEIQSPVYETLLSYQFINNPSDEIKFNHTITYTTKNHPKAKGIEIKAELPRSWKQKEGARPNVIQLFTSENGKGLETILFMVYENEVNLNDDTTIDEFMEIIQSQFDLPNSELLSTKPVTLDGRRSVEMIYKSSGKRLNIEIASKSISYVTYYNDKLILLQCSVGDLADKNIDAQFDLFMPLFRKVAISLVIMNQW